MANERFPILGFGERLVNPVTVRSGGGSKKHVRTFAEARDRLIPQLEVLSEQIDSLTENLRLTRIFFLVMLDSSYLAKSYFPNTLNRSMGWEMVGSRPWWQTDRDGIDLTKPMLGRSLFFCTDQKQIEYTRKRLVQGTGLNQSEQDDFVKIDSVFLPAGSDRLINIDQEFESGVVELLFHPMTAREWRECEEKMEALCNSDRANNILWGRRRGGGDQPYFVPAVISSETIQNLSGFNPLRAARPMPGVSFPRVRRDTTNQAGNPPGTGVLRETGFPEIGVFDGGVDDSVPHLTPWVEGVDLTPEEPEEFSIEHGTAVCGAVLYGSCLPNRNLDPPKMKVRSFRVFPTPKIEDIDLELYQILDWIEDTVTNEQYRHIKAFVLSFGPDIPVEDQEVNLFTTTLDRLAMEHDVLFIVAAGNTGQLHPPLNRLQPPADIVNGLGVGAYSYEERLRIIPALYSSVGPGRPGSSIKPDICGFGGSDSDPFYVLLPGSDGQIAGTQGTSFAAPFIGSTAGALLYRANMPEALPPQMVKALIIHNASRPKGWDPNSYGWGALVATPDQIASCTGNEVTVLYNGIMSFGNWMRLQVPFPDDLDFGGQVYFNWTFTYASGISPGTPDDYTLAGAEIHFRPNASNFGFSKKDENYVFVNVKQEQAKVNELQNDGWKQSAHPRAKNPKREQELRELGKWDTVVRGQKRQARKDVESPVLDVHALARAEWETSKGPDVINYAAVITVRATDPQVQLYQRIRQTMPMLVPVELRARARRRV